ncbi:hypothetical protein BRADI_1g32791v3 [Brachypodium distachyon]|uniref:Reverse transcriptase zinc-binding domain-containing protein n=1 Tax=Brachypodium distachyon TaxID=15368 RepID=A0A0Q3JH80_BRADI|nr:hypothetical protein BRADI_1g32791v3 [Brachypodium distachyon]
MAHYPRKDLGDFANYKGRIKVRTVLKKQQILATDECPFGCTASESPTHLALECSCSRLVFQMLGIDVVGVRQIDDLFIHEKTLIAQNKVAACEVVTVAVLWNIWLARNRKVFDDQIISVPMVVRQCSETLKLWCHRLKSKEKLAAQKWLEDWPS